MEGHAHVAFSSSPNGSRITSGSSDRTIRIWDDQTGIQIHRLDGHEGVVNFVAFSSDGHWIASGSHDKTVRICTGQPVGHPLISRAAYVAKTHPTESRSQPSTFHDIQHHHTMAEYYLEVILPSYPPAALWLLLRGIHIKWARIYREYGPQTLMGGKYSYPSHPSPLILRNATRFVRYRWLHLILESVERGTNEEVTTRGPQLDTSVFHQSIILRFLGSHLMDWPQLFDTLRG